jgi:hypothetical protein
MPYALRPTPYVSRSSVLGSFLAVLLTLSLGGCGSGSGGNEPPNPNPNPGGGNTVLPVTAPGLEVTANENLAGENFVDIDKYNQAIENYNAMGAALAGDTP